MQHRRRWAVWGGVLVIVGVLTIGMWVSAATGALAQTGQTEEVDQANNTQCSVATLKGTYLVSFSGMNVVDSQQVPLAVAGYQVFDGKGKATGVVTVSVNGAISRHSPVSAEYTVNKD